VKKLSGPIEETSKEKDVSFKVPTLRRQRASHEKQRKLIKSGMLLPNLQNLSPAGAFAMTTGIGFAYLLEKLSLKSVYFIRHFKRFRDDHFIHLFKGLQAYV
jgi:hypothetical protein